MLLKSLGHRIIPFTSSYINQKTRDGLVFLSCCTDLKAFYHLLCSLWNKRVSIRVTTLTAASSILCLSSEQGILCFSVMLSWAAAQQHSGNSCNSTLPLSLSYSSCHVLGCLGNHYRTTETGFTDYMELYAKLQLWSWQNDEHRKIQKDLAPNIRGQFETGDMKQNTWGITDLTGLTLEPQ